MNGDGTVSFASSTMIQNLFSAVDSTKRILEVSGGHTAIDYDFYGVAPNPIISFEDNGVSDFVEVRAEEISALLDMQDENLRYYGNLGRYALYANESCTLLVDVYSEDIYFNEQSDAHSKIQKFIQEE